MNILIILLLIAVITTLGYVLYLLVRAILAQMAERNLLFTFRTEGEIKAIMKGDKCVRYLMAVDNHLIDPDDFDIHYGSIESYRQYLKRKAEERKSDPTFNEQKLDENNGWSFKEDFLRRLQQTNPANEKEQSWLERKFGVVWIDFPPYHVFEYRFRWTKFMGETSVGSDAEKRPGYTMVRRDEVVNSLYFRYPNYVAEVKEAETGSGSIGGAITEGKRLEKVQINVILVFETVTKNPQKTLFRSTGLSSAGDWLVAVTAEIQSHLRSWIGQKTYDQLISVSGSEDKSSTEILKEVIEAINRKIIRDYGQEITVIRVVSVELTDKTLQATVLEFFKAKQKADAAEETKRGRMTLADATERENAAPGLGKAKGYDAIVKARGERIAISENLGNLRGVYAPARDGVFLNVATGATGENPPDENPPREENQKVISEGDEPQESPPIPPSKKTKKM